MCIRDSLCSVIFILPCAANAEPNAGIPITVKLAHVVCRHTYGDPPTTVETKHLIPSGSSIEDAKRIGREKCVEAGVNIRKKLDEEAGGPGKSRANYPLIHNLIAGIQYSYVTFILPFGVFSSADGDDLSDAAVVSAEEPSDPAIVALINGELDPSDLTEEQISALQAEAISEEYTAQSYIDIELPTTSE